MPAAKPTSSCVLSGNCLAGCALCRTGANKSAKGHITLWSCPASAPCPCKVAHLGEEEMENWRGLSSGAASSSHSSGGVQLLKSCSTSSRLRPSRWLYLQLKRSGKRGVRQATTVICH